MDIEEKSPGAFLTIGEVSARLGIQQHILRFWETRFPQLRPLKRSGNRRYYRPEDVALVQLIDELLNRQGYTIQGAQKRVRDQARGGLAAAPAPMAAATANTPDHVGSRPESANDAARFDRAALRAIRDMLADALERTGAV